MAGTAQDITPGARDFAFRSRATVTVVDGAGATTAGVAADQEGEVASQEGAQDHDAAADNGEVGFDDDKGGRCGNVPGAVEGYVEEDGDVVGAYGGEDAGSVFRFSGIRELGFLEWEEVVMWCFEGKCRLHKTEWESRKGRTRIQL